MNKELEIEIEAPWGKLDSTSSGLKFIEHAKQQLEFFIKNGQAYRKYNIEIDIRGYQELLDAKSEENVDLFLKLKRLDATGKGRTFRSNRAVIDYMKRTSQWKVNTDVL